MAKVGGAFVCILIVVMDIVAGILGIKAEIEQNKVRHLRFMIFECKEPSDTAFKLGLAAAGLLALAHVIANLLGGCVCICSKDELYRSSANKQLATASLIISWIVLAVGFGTLMIGAMTNSRSRRKCGISHHNFLSIGGILCFVHGLFCVAYYVSAIAFLGEEDKASRRDRGSGHQMAERGNHAVHT